MKAKVLGIQKVDYTSRKTNKQVTGVTLHISYPSSNVDGQAVETVFISERSNVSLDGVGLDSTVELSYNRWGSVDNLAICK